MSKASAKLVREGLQAYAERKIFRNFVEERGKGGLIRFTFHYLGPDVTTLEFHEQDHTLVIRNMLPRVPRTMCSDLQDFLEKLHDPALPPYRRIDRSLADAHFMKRGRNVSLVFRVKSNRYRYGVDKLIEPASWIRTYLQGGYQTYLWEALGEPVD